MRDTIKMNGGSEIVEGGLGSDSPNSDDQDNRTPAVETLDTGLVAAAAIRQGAGLAEAHHVTELVSSSPHNESVKPTADDEIARFMARVVPWPETRDAPGFVNLHWTFWDGAEPPKNPPWGGIATKDVEEFMQALDRVRSHPNTRDIYFCLSLQAATRLNKGGRVVAARSAQNALSLKSIWLDIDVKEPPKGYATLAEATDALSAFCQSAKLPPPSAVVHSGGGLHVYWINDTPLLGDEWRSYAVGLKAAAVDFGLRCDAQCTVNPACVLRVPGTLNFKKYPARPVSIGAGP